jgi:hypothetical protein
VSAVAYGAHGFAHYIWAMGGDMFLGQNLTLQ